MPAGFVWEALGAEQFLFNPLSGQTHVLNPMGAMVLEALASSPHSEPELLQLLATQDSAADPEVLRAYLKQHLRQLEELGLIEQLR